VCIYHGLSGASSEGPNGLWAHRRLSNLSDQDCVKGGSPLVILTKDDRLYFPISAKMPDADQRQVLMPFVGKYVRASGIVFERTGTHAIVITEINEMKEVRVKDEE